MTYTKEILLGRIIKIHGYDGSVTLKLEKSFIENIPEMESVFLEIQGRPVPFFISHSEYAGADILKLKFEDYSSFEKISEFQGCRVFLTTVKNNNNVPDDNLDLKGYKVFIQDDRLVGVVKEVIQNPGQWLLSVVSDAQKEILIPFHENFIVKMDPGNKSITMNLPEGLTEIN